MSESKKPSKQYNKHPCGFAPKVQPNNIPQDLKDNMLWCVWKATEKFKADGTRKIDKIPYNVNGRLSTAKPKLWMSFDDAIAVYEDAIDGNGEHLYNGVGILVRDIVGIDIDGDLDLGVWEEVDTYKEFSPSGKGLRILGEGWTDGDLTKPVEIYSGNAPRFVTITGDTINGSTMSDIGDMANEIVLANKGNIVSDKPVANAAIPELIEFADQEWWPVHALNLPAAGQRSDTLFGWSRTLVSEGLTNQQVLSIYANNPSIMDMAADHWGERKALNYLWRDITRARLEVVADYDNDVGDFADIEGIVDFDSVDRGETTLTGDKEIDHLLVLKDKQNDRYDKVENDVLQPWNREIIAPLPSTKKIKFCYRNVVFNGKNGKFHVLDRFGFVNVFGEKDYIPCCVPMKKLVGKLEGVGDADEFVKTAKANFLKGVKSNRQISSFNKRVDMFINKPLFVRDESGLVEHIVPHRTFLIDAGFEDITNKNELVAGYIQHFPQLDEFLEFIVNSRFASNRRKCSLWLQAGSNWGKGFLTSVFEDLGIVTSITEDELEKAFSGAPLGKNMNLIYKSWILHIDEFKKVKSELKLLDNSMVGASKNELETKIQVYVKLFTSAETVNSLAGETGVDKQFENRFSYFDGLEGDIENINGWGKSGQLLMFKTVKNYIAGRLNGLVAEMVALGRSGATVKGDKGVTAFHNEHRITKAFHSLEDSLEECGEDFVKLVNRVHSFGVEQEYGDNSKLEKEIKDNVFKVKWFGEDYLFLKRPVNIVQDYLYSIGGRSEGVKLSYKAGQVLNLAAALPIRKERLTLVKVYKGVTASIKAKGVFLPILKAGLDEMDGLEGVDGMEEIEDF